MRGKEENAKEGKGEVAEWRESEREKMTDKERP